MTLVGIIQSSYIPWRGYFDFIDEVDVFIFLDDVQYTRRDWRNRNKIKIRSTSSWLTVPVNDIFGVSLIQDTPINYGMNWREDHLRRLRDAYETAPYWSSYAAKLESFLLFEYRTISELNQTLTRWICDELKITTELRNSSEFAVGGIKDVKLRELVRAVGGDGYLSGPSALTYLKPEEFKAQNIDLLIKNYRYSPYPQLSEPFIGEVSVLDLLFNCGPGSRNFLKSDPPYHHMCER